MLPTVFVPTSLIINPIIKTPKNIYNNKYPKKKQKPFTERTGDWICKKCKNLNFAFRQECNRCKLPRKEVEIEEKKEEKKEEEENNNISNDNNKADNNNETTKNNNYNGQQYNNRKNKYRFKKYNYVYG
jgi:hypothetical protein